MSTSTTIRRFLRLALISLAVSGGSVAATGLRATVDTLSPANPREIRQALSCAAFGKARLLGTSRNGSVFEIRSRIDTNSFPGERHLLLMVGSGQRRTLLDFRISSDDKVYRLTNNAYIKSRGTRIDFVAEPLGGIWAHDYLAGFASKVALSSPVKISAPSHALVKCEYYYNK